MTKEAEAAAAAAAAASPTATKKRPAEEADEPAEKPEPEKQHHHHHRHEAAAEQHPMHDPGLPPDVVEEGRIYFFYKMRVGKAGAGGDTKSVGDLDDVQRSFMLLAPLAASDEAVGEGREALETAEAASPAHGRPLNRIFVLPKKSLPGAEGPGEARLAINVGVAETVAELTQGLHASTYETKTRGTREQPAARVVASGVYLIVAPTAGPVARAARQAAAAKEKKKRGTEEDEGGEEQQQPQQQPQQQQPQQQQPEKKKARLTAAEKAVAAAASARHGRAANSSRLLWLLEAPQKEGPAQHMMGLEHRGAFAIKVKGPLGDRGGGTAPPPPDPDTLPGPARARLEAAHTKWVDVDTHAVLDFKGAQLLMIAQYAIGGAKGPGALEQGGPERDRAAMGEEAGPEASAALAELVAGDARRLKADAKEHGEPARGDMPGALRRALLAELEKHEDGDEDEEGGDGDGDEEEEARRWAAHHEEAERQLRAHEREEAAAEREAGGAAAEDPLVLEPALTGAVV